VTLMHAGCTVIRVRTQHGPDIGLFLK